MNMVRRLMVFFFFFHLRFLFRETHYLIYLLFFVLLSSRVSDHGGDGFHQFIGTLQQLTLRLIINVYLF
jgi:hypothetical protein